MDELIAFFTARLADYANEADRKLLWQYEIGKALLPGGYKLGYCEAIEDVIKIRAERFSDHPDYSAEWKPPFEAVPHAGS